MFDFCINCIYLCLEVLNLYIVMLSFALSYACIVVYMSNWEFWVETLFCWNGFEKLLINMIMMDNCVVRKGYYWSIGVIWSRLCPVNYQLFETVLVRMPSSRNVRTWLGRNSKWAEFETGLGKIAKWPNCANVTWKDFSKWAELDEYTIKQIG